MLKPEPDQTPSLNILIVEDNTFLRKLFGQALDDDHHVCMASNAEQAWQMYQDFRPDITFLDIKLPDINGHDLAARIKGHDPKAYIVMVTSSTRIGDRHEARLNDVDGYIIKPFSKRKISSTIDQYMAERGILDHQHGNSTL